MVKPSDGIRKKFISRPAEIQPAPPLDFSPFKSEEDTIPTLLKKFAKSDDADIREKIAVPAEVNADTATNKDELIIIEPDPAEENVFSSELSSMQSGQAMAPKFKGAEESLKKFFISVGKIFFSPNIFSARRGIFWGVVSGVISLLILVILLSTVFARATLEIKPRVESVKIEDVAIGFDTSISKVLDEQRVIPAERLEFNRSAAEEFEATGREIIEEKARGTARIYNQFSSSPQGLVQSTRFVTDGGAIYRLTKSVVVPGAKIEQGKIVPQYIEAELAADKSGEEHNLSGEARMKIPGFQDSPKYEGFYATAPSGFSGGFKGDARVVSREDLVKAQEQVTKKVFDELRQEIARKVPPDFKLMDSLSEIEITEVSAPREKSRRDRFSVEAKADGRVLVFREKDVLEFLKRFVLGEDSSRKLKEESANLEYRARNLDFNKGRADVFLGGTIKTSAVIPQDEIAELVRGKKTGTISELLKTRNDVAESEIFLFPPWLFKTPGAKEKIRFKIGMD